MYFVKNTFHGFLFVKTSILTSQKHHKCSAEVWSGFKLANCGTYIFR